MDATTAPALVTRPAPRDALRRVRPRTCIACPRANLRLPCPSEAASLAAALASRAAAALARAAAATLAAAAARAATTCDPLPGAAPRPPLLDAPPPVG